MNFRTKFNFLPMLAFALMCFTIVSCNKDPEPGVDPVEEVVETTVEEDKENIQLTLDNMLVCVEEMTAARSIDILLRDFLQMSNGEVANDEWTQNMSENFTNVFDFEHIDENGRFNVTHHTGRYYFDHSTGAWAKVPTIDNLVIIQFPTSPDKTENDANFVIDKYEDQVITMDGEDIYAPSLIHAQMAVDGQRLFELSLDKVTYDDNATYEIPVEIDATLFMDPFEVSLDVNRVSTTEFTGMLAFNDGNTCRMSLEADLALTDDDFENLTEDSVEKLHAKVRIGDLTIQSLAGLAELMGQEDPDESTINSLLDLDVLFKDLKIADLEYDEEEENFVLFYKDESSESAANYIDSFMEDMEAIIEEFTGEW